MPKKHPITRFEIFSTLDNLEAGIIARSVYHRKFKPRETIVNEGDAAAGIYLIKSGEVKVLKTYKSRQIELDTLRGGTYFGELTLLGDRMRTASVIAVEHTEIICLYRPEFLEIMHNYPTLCAKLLPNISSTLINRLRRTQENILSISE